MNSKAKILYFVHLPPPLHGVSTVSKTIFDSEKINANIEKRLIRINYSDNLDQLDRISLNKIYKLINLWFRLLFHLISFKPSYVYWTIVPLGNGFIRDSLFVILFKLFNTKPIYHLHGNGISEVKSKFRLKLYRFVFSNSIVIHLSKGLMKKEITPLKIKNSITYSVPNGVDDLLNDSHENIRNGKVNILYLSNYSESKGLYVLVEAIKILKQKELNFYVTVVGKPFNVNDKKLDNLLQEYNIKDDVSFVGPKYGAEKDDEFKQADIFVFPTLNDTFPLVLIEAMKYSLPIVGSMEGAIPEIIDDGETGYIVKKRNFVSVAIKLEKLIKNDSLREEMGRKGYNKFKVNYTNDVFEQRMSDIFKKNVN